jgi:DNA-binding transcriptional MerR regulator
MDYLEPSRVAAFLNVTPNTLRAWERRLGFPNLQRSPGSRRHYPHDEAAALKDSLQDGLCISSAVSRACEGMAADTNSLVGALVSYEVARADAAIEAALALRSIERSIEDSCFPASTQSRERTKGAT